MSHFRKNTTRPRPLNLLHWKRPKNPCLKLSKHNMSNTHIEKTVYLVRHGQSEGNIAAAFQGPDSPLSEKGKMQAENIADRVSKLSFDAFIASPFRRARETAEVIAQATGKQIEYSELFTERIKPTSLNDKPHEDEKARASWKEWERSLHTSGMRVEDGENFDDLLARADKALEYLKNRPEKSLVVVTHGYFLRTMVARVLLGDFLSEGVFKRFHAMVSMENTGLTILRYHGKQGEDPMWRLWIYNDHAHLAE